MRKPVSLGIAFIPLLVLVALIAAVVSVFGDETLAGASQIALIVAAAVAVGIGLLRRDIVWDDFEREIGRKMGDLSVTIFILLLIGALGGSWMVSGVVPTLIYYGVQMMSPSWFLLSACLICALVSVMTGSSWTTIATIGVALIGIGGAMGIEQGWVAGAIVSGAYFGDKISPLSDTTVLASSTVGTPLFTHIRYMLWTTVPTFAITLLILAAKGIGTGGVDMHQVDLVQQGLSSTFVLSPWLLVVPVITGVMIYMRLPSVVVLFMATLIATVTASAVQGELLDQIAGADHEGWMQRFRGAMIVVSGSTSLDTGVPELNRLVATHGMSGMMGTIWLILCAALFGSAMSVAGMIESIMRSVVRLARGLISTVACTAATGFFFNVAIADQYLSIILTSNIFSDLYRKRGYESRLLSRTVEDGTTVTSVLIPWNTCGMTQSSVLGVSTLAYAPYAFFCYLSPLMTVLAAAVMRRRRDCKTPFIVQ